MRILQSVLAGLCLSLLRFVNALDLDDAEGRTLKKSGSKKGKKSGSKESASCTRETYSFVHPNDEWEGHTFHPQVWYHSLEDAHHLWEEGYFDYVLDVRPVEDQTLGSGTLLEGWGTFHIPGSFPLDLVPSYSLPAEETEMLVNFMDSNVCKDARIFIHCWSGVAGNLGAERLVQLGFTNMHTMGPDGSAGVWHWMEAGYPLVYGDEFDPNKKRFNPKCLKKC